MQKKKRRQAIEAAKAFARMCETGRADMHYNAASWLNKCDAWKPAMSRVAKLQRVSREIQAAFLPIWIESKTLPRRVGNRRVLADALRVLFPADYSGVPMLLYRGTRGRERRCRLYGFSWTADIAVARRFAQEGAYPADLAADLGIRASDAEGVILQTLAPPEAILLIRRPEEGDAPRLTPK